MFTMKRISIALSLAFACIAGVCHGQEKPDVAITYTVPHGRLGDRLLVYAGAKYLSLKYNVPLLFKPFASSDLFALSVQERQFHESDEAYYTNKVELTGLTKPVTTTRPQTLFVLTGARPSACARIRDDSAMLAEIRKMFAPTFAVTSPMTLPDNCVSVAVHIRRGSGPDHHTSAPTEISNASNPNDALHEALAKRYPLKFPPEQYYADQLNFLMTLLGQRNVYICVFTDDKNPAAVVEKLKKLVTGSNISWNYDPANTQDQKAVATSLFAMTTFDCFVRGQSHLAVVADLLGNHSLVISPTKYTWQGNKLTVTESRAVFRDLATGADISRTTFSEKNHEQLSTLIATVLKDKGMNT